MALFLNRDANPLHEVYMKSPAPPTREEQRNYLRQMRQGHEMAEVRGRAELARLNYEQNLPILNSLLEIGFQFRRPQPTSGLIEWHRLMTQLENARRMKSSRR